MDRLACRRISASFDAIAVDRIDLMVEGFYRRLFERAPEVRKLFKEDMTIQREHLAASIALVARNIEHLDILEESLMLLGAQHVGFGARPEHYLTVREAMLEAIGSALGSYWTDQLRADWYDALSQICTIMLKGAAMVAIEGVTRRAP
jgi:nitric oxide dioxygenase